MKISKDIRRIIFFALLAIVASYIFLLKAPLAERGELNKRQEQADLIQITPLKPVVADTQSAKAAGIAIKQEGFEKSSKTLKEMAQRSNVVISVSFNGLGGSNVSATGKATDIMKFITSINAGVQYTKDNQLRATTAYSLLQDIRLKGESDDFSASFTINPTPLPEK